MLQNRNTVFVLNQHGLKYCRLCACKLKLSEIQNVVIVYLFQSAACGHNTDVCFFKGLEKISTKKRNDVKKQVQKIVEKRYTKFKRFQGCNTQHFRDVHIYIL